ncbi:hypothetical protein [Mycobacterium sp. C31M]
MQKTLKTFASALLAGGLLVGCGSQSTEPQAAPSATESTAPAPTTLTIETVENANSTLEELAGAQLADIQVQSISISPSGNLSVDALDPGKPTELNQYVAYPDGRTDVRPYDYGGAEKYDALLATLFSADLVDPETMVSAWEDSFNRVQGDRAEMDASGVTVAWDNINGVVEMYIVNGPERDRQTVYYDPTGAFLRVS